MSRINLYAEELTDDTELVVKTAVQPSGEARTFYGVRVYLKSPPELHATPADDDRSAITFWIPWTKAGGYDTNLLHAIFAALDLRVDDAESAMKAFETQMTDQDRQAEAAREQKADASG